MRRPGYWKIQILVTRHMICPFSRKSQEPSERFCLIVRSLSVKAQLKQMSGEIDILHIASPSIFDRANPLISGLLLHGDTANDVVLSVEELYETELDVSLVTLSAG